jgi:hypothetical protein
MEIVTAGVANRCDESFRALTTNIASEKPGPLPAGWSTASTFG